MYINAQNLPKIANREDEDDASHWRAFLNRMTICRSEPEDCFNAEEGYSLTPAHFAHFIQSTLKRFDETEDSKKMSKVFGSSYHPNDAQAWREMVDEEEEYDQYVGKKNLRAKKLIQQRVLQQESEVQTQMLN